MNLVILIGNVGADPEIRELSSGKQMATFNLATSEKWKDREGNQREETQWHSIVFYGPVCKVIEGYVKKGSKITVEGKIKYTESVNEQGEKRFYINIVGHNLHL